MNQKSLKEVKQSILKLDPLNSSCFELEELIRNALHIMSENSIDISRLSHTYNNKELSSLINGGVNQKRIGDFKGVQERCKFEIPEEDLYIETIPESWPMPPVVRLDTSY